MYRATVSNGVQAPNIHKGSKTDGAMSRAKPDPGQPTEHCRHDATALPVPGNVPQQAAPATCCRFRLFPHGDADRCHHVFTVGRSILRARNSPISSSTVVRRLSWLYIYIYRQVCIGIRRGTPLTLLFRRTPPSGDLEKEEYEIGRRYICYIYAGSGCGHR